MLKVSDILNKTAYDILAQEEMSPEKALKLLKDLERDPKLQKEVAEALSGGAKLASVSSTARLTLLALSILMGTAMADMGKKNEVRDMLSDQAFSMSKLNINQDNIKKVERLKSDINKDLAGIAGKGSGVGTAQTLGKRKFVIDTKEKASVMKKIQDMVKVLESQKRGKEISDAAFSERVEKLSQAYRTFERGGNTQLC